MRIVIGNFNFIRPAGTETYVLTVAPRLVQMGHEVTIFSLAIGPLADEARRRGLKVTDAPRGLPDDCDFVFTQDGPTAYALAEHYPAVPQVFVCHSVVFDIAHPPRLPALVRAIVTLNGRTTEHMRAFGLEAEVVRLSQPVDTGRFSPRAPLGERPTRALLLGNYLRGVRRRTLVDALASEQIEVVELGRHAGAFRTDADAAMNEVDIVVGRGRVMVEAMACGRAAYLYDQGGTDGWVTTESHPLMEANNFSGQATDRVPDREAIRRDISSYDPLMGPVNRDLAFRHHDHTKHVEALIEVIERHAQRRAAIVGPLEEMAWLARQNWLSESRAYDLGLEVGTLHAELAALRGRLDELSAGADGAAAERDAAAEGLAQWRARALEAERRNVEHEAFRRTRRYRLATSLARPLDAARRTLRR